MSEDRVFDGEWRLLSDDPVAGVRRWFLADPATGQQVIKTETYVTDMIDANKAAYNDGPVAGFGDYLRVASVPMDVYYAQLNKAVVEGDTRYVKRWLEDSDNRAWRTHKARL